MEIECVNDVRDKYPNPKSRQEALKCVRKAYC
jgi:hypothetical protein